MVKIIWRLFDKWMIKIKKKSVWTNLNWQHALNFRDKNDSNWFVAVLLFSCVSRAWPVTRNWKYFDPNNHLIIKLKHNLMLLGIWQLLGRGKKQTKKTNISILDARSYYNSLFLCWEEIFNSTFLWLNIFLTLAADLTQLFSAITKLITKAINIS